MIYVQKKWVRPDIQSHKIKVSKPMETPVGTGGPSPPRCSSATEAVTWFEAEPKNHRLMFDVGIKDVVPVFL